MTLLLATLAVLVGVSVGLLGGGGSILTLPLLVYVGGLSPRDAVAASLFVVGVASAAALIGHARAGRVHHRHGLLFGAGSMVGAFAGGRLAHLVSGRILLGAFTVMMLATGLAMMRPRAETVPRPATGAALGRAVIAGVAIGVVTGLVGAGGGFVIVPALTLLLGLPMPVAIGTSLLVISMNSLAGFAGAITHASLPWPLVGGMALAAAVGAAVGSRLVGRVRPASLRRGFAWLVLAMTVFMASQQLSRTWALLVAAAIAAILLAGSLRKSSGVLHA
jgi:uncharacterized membrane protein YfcA